MRKTIMVIKKAIEDEPWDEKVDDSEEFLNCVSWIAIVLAVAYFGPVIIGIINR